MKYFALIYLCYDLLHPKICTAEHTTNREDCEVMRTLWNKENDEQAICIEKDK